MSRKSVLSKQASVVEPELPLRAYFLSVGAALLLLLLAADWALPAPLPNRLIDQHSALPQIRIHSELKGPEAVIIDTGRFGAVPMPPEHDIGMAPSQLAGPEVATAAASVRDGSPAPTADLRFRESLAQLQSPVRDQASEATRSRDVAARQRTLAQAHAGKRRRPTRHPGFEAGLGGRDSSSCVQGPCRYALMPN